MAGDVGGRTDGSVSSTSVIRSAHTAARGTIINTNVAIITDIRICMRYCRNAVSEPISMAPASTRCAPNQRTAMLETLKKNMMIGNISASSRPTRSAVSVSSAFARPKRSPLEVLADEGANHPDAADLLSQHPVEHIDPGLHLAELRHHPRHQQADGDSERRAR